MPAACTPTADSRWAPPHRLLPTQSCSLRLPGWTHPRTVPGGSTNAGSRAGFGAFPDNSPRERGPVRTRTHCRRPVTCGASGRVRPVPAFSPFRDGHYWCSKCPRRGFTTIPGLMRHITHQHAGSLVDESTCSLFTAIERVTCTAPACGGLRRMGARVCNRCGQASQARPPQVGDVIMGPLGAPVNGEDTAMVDADVTVTPSLTVDLPIIDLPLDFTQRIRVLPSSTILHVPASCRLRMISAVAQCWNGMAQGRDDYAQLEEGRSKLLLSSVPQGLSAATEVLKRLTL